ncbi:cobyrinic acid a,c-diamide synthase [Methanosalsum zhilinae DSM 4017]|uniref:Cobyrinate a,c-diamide synthase n=1 Tax=Methanosalsum zhilinae (strain DSM 4017 / NBRC 107636 / OCM 62 / WeN5) TaxID=679901 RepID=F7XPY8_METZD|nr:cobyrinate a,c-diamide synthase [Methanosalsum zhilinae]AEH61511.1 cobyrinic acid a,c-diamide synthase [Methanosalsum zhilinae DSM 4017]
MTRALLIAGTHSGVGKTTVAMGIMAALTKRGQKVKPYKVGPDYIDPTHHSVICSQPSHNLDTYMMDIDGVRSTFARTSQEYDISVVEGVMGLFDGMESTEIASSAHVAKSLDLPVILVINVHGMSRSAAALAHGYMNYDPGVRVAGVILNRVGSPRHAQMIKDVMEDVPVVGALPRNQDITVPSRHLGLHMASEKEHNIDELAAFIEENIDLDTLIQIADTAPDYEPEADIPDLEPDLTIGVAMDSAFCFYYQDMLDAFRRHGAQIRFFSPLAGEVPDVDGIYFGGGYPELHLGELEKSETTRALSDLASDGVPIYGECGGLLYLCSSYEDSDAKYRMADVFPADVRMTKKLQALGYTRARAKGGYMDTTILGHEFHYSVTECDRDCRLIYEMIRGKGIQDGRDGITEHSSLASYMHAHPATFPAGSFVQQCRKYSRR